MAFGSLLHTIEDSFSEAHVAREKPTLDKVCGTDQDFKAPGRITAFYAYNRQSGALHKAKDQLATAEEQLQDSVSVVTVGAKVLELLRNGKQWESVAPIFECIFNIVDGSVKAGPGPFEAKPVTVNLGPLTGR